MKRIIYSLSTKFVVNVVMIASFGISAATGLIKPGGHHQRPPDFRSEQVAPAPGILTAGFADPPSVLSLTGRAEPGQEAHENTHVYFGLFWLALMIFHTLQHWSWFKKMFTLEHIKKNKLLMLTVIFFLIMAVSGVIMWMDLVPRDVFNFREIHEFTGQALLVLLSVHVIQRVKWYVTVYPRVLKRKTILA